MERHPDRFGMPFFLKKEINVIFASAIIIEYHK